MADSKYRVKLYSFGENLQWMDLGTGRVSLSYLERLQGLALVIRADTNGAIMLESKILLDRNYQKQEETLIIWNEDSICDVAVSFHDKIGCDEIWHKICEFQGKDPNLDRSQDMTKDGDLSEGNSDTSLCIELPQCELSKLDEIHNIITSSVSSAAHRDILTLALEKDNYIQKLLDLFKISEDLENLEALHHLYSIFRTLFLLNKPSLLSVMFLPDNIMNVIGCLEYDPNKSHPVRHRHYIEQTSKYKEVIPLYNAEIMEKIHVTYKMCYIQEVILPTPSLFEENLMSAFNSFILFNKTDIVNAIQEDRRLLYELFSKLSSDSVSIEKYREYSLFLRELCSFAQALETEKGTEFYHRLCTFELMVALEQMLTCEVEDIVSVAVDIINQIGDYNSSILRDHILKQNDIEEDSQFLNVIIGLLVDAEFTSIDVQLVGLIRSLIDPENIMTETAAQTAEKAIFLNYFYKHCMHRLLAPLMAQTTADNISKDTSQNAVLLSHILDLLSLCVERHTHYIRKYIIERNLLGRVLVLMTSFHRHLILAALRFCRKIVGLKDEFYNNYIIKNNLFAPIVKTFIANGQRYNLVNSAIIELFEFIKSENIKSLIIYIVENFIDHLESIQYVSTFQAFKLKYDQVMDDTNNSSIEQSKGIIYGIDVGRFRRDPRDLEEDEESWFDEEEESIVTDNVSATTPPSVASLPRLSTPLNSSPSLLQYSPRPSLTRSPIHTTQIKLPSKFTSSALQSLVDYDEDSDEETTDDDNFFKQFSKTPKLNNNL